MIFFARYEASTYGCEYIETEHILLGVMRESRGLLLQVLGPNADEKGIVGGSDAGRLCDPRWIDESPNCYQPIDRSTYTKNQCTIQVHVLAGIPFYVPGAGQYTPSRHPLIRGGRPPQPSIPSAASGARRDMHSYPARRESGAAAPAAFHPKPRRPSALNFRIPPPMVHVLRGCGPVRAYWEVRAPLARREAQLQSASCTASAVRGRSRLTFKLPPPAVFVLGGC